MPSVENREAKKTYLEILKKKKAGVDDTNLICLPGNLICIVKNTKMPEGGSGSEVVGWKKNSTEKSKPASTESDEHHQTTTTTVGCVDFEKLCDGIQDCVNGEDESFCQ